METSLRLGNLFIGFTYTSLLAGLPNAQVNERIKKWNLSLAQKIHGDPKIIRIKPKITLDEKELHLKFPHHFKKVEYLPPFFVIAEYFYSIEDSVVVLIYQDHFGPPKNIKKYLLRKINSNE